MIATQPHLAHLDALQSIEVGCHPPLPHHLEGGSKSLCSCFTHCWDIVKALSEGAGEGEERGENCGGRKVEGGEGGGYEMYTCKYCVCTYALMCGNACMCTPKGDRYGILYVVSA